MKKKISAILVASIVVSNASPALNVYANEVVKEKVQAVEEKVVSEAKISAFNLSEYTNFEGYNSEFKILREEIKSISNNGGQYGSSSIDKAIDGNLSTHWETGKSNSSTFQNEVVVEFNEIESIDRIAYATRQDGAKGKGFPTQFEIYASTTGEDSDFELVSTGAHSSTGNMMEFKFDTITAKKVKFVFKEANQGWASASEFYFYREDKSIDKLNSIFTNENMNEISEEFNTLDKLSDFENKVKNHPLYEEFKTYINNARLILEGNNVEYKDAVINKFKSFNDEALLEYNKLFKINPSSISTNGSHYGSSNIEKAIDGDINTSWHSGKQNSSSFINEVIISLDKLETLDRVVYTSLNSRGFANSFDIYTSKTTEGDTFEKVTSGSSSITKDSLEIKFNPTEARRVKFVYKQCYENWALASEFALYKEDKLKDKMGRLFTDNSMSKVSEEFNTVDKINALEEEAKSHPFYEDYKEDLSNARLLVDNSNVQYTDAKVSKFLDINSKLLSGYDEVYKLDITKIKSITANGGHYASEVISKAIDGDFNTKWHSGKQNTDTFTNEVVMELDELTTLNRIVYTAPRGSNRGFAQEFEVYASRTTKGDNFEKVSAGSSSVTQDSVEIRFNPTEFKRVKFVLKKGYENWACAAEISLYKQDEISEKMEKLFTNGLYNQLSEEFNSVEAINKLEEELSTHPLKELYSNDIELAKDLVNNPDKFENVTIITAEQRGKYTQEIGIRSINGAAYSSFQSTGLYVTQGEEITVYVEADENGVMPRICFGQSGKGQGDWRRWANLQPGKNVIKAPSGINPSAVYIVNDALPKDQAFAPKLRIEGGNKFPTYIHGKTDANEFANEVKEYAQKVEYNDNAFTNGNPEGKVFNIVELVSENCIITTSAAGAVEALKTMEKTNLTVEDTMNEWEEMYDMFQTFQGFEKDAKEEKDSYFPNKFIARVFQNVPLGFADHGYTGYLGSSNIERNGGFFKQIVLPITHRDNDNWCYTHEFGHIFNTKYVVDGEVTNNLYAQEFRRIKGLGGDRANWNEIMKRFNGQEFAMHYFERLDVLSQINIAYGYDAYAKMSTYVRHNTSQISSVKGSDQQRLAVAYSLALNVNLLDFFEGWNYITVTDQMREVVANLPKLDKKIEYLHGGAYDYKGNGFDENLKIEVSSKLNEENATNTLSFTIDSENSDDLLGYEILKDNEVIGFTRGNNFVVKSVDVNENTIYEVVAYAKDLSTAKGVSVKAFSPILSVQQDNMMVSLNSQFNAEDFAKALNYKGEDISSNIIIESNVNTSKKGNYQVKYTLVDNEVELSKTVDIEVVSSFDYLSDSDWESVETQHGTPRRNSNLKGRVNGEIKAFDKGIGIHANGKVVYNLEGKNYDTFEALVGVDGTIAAQDNSSITFKVVADEQTVATTRVLKYSDNMVYISVPVSGISKLEIQVNNGGNGNTSDYGVIINPKLSNNNMKPSIDISKTSDIVKLGQEYDLTEGVTASDIEDGELTKAININSNGFTTNKTGRYIIEYTVTDSDNNTTTVSKNIVVYSDVVYASNTDWQSATTDWQSVRKDKSSSNGTIKVGIDGQTKEFEKGIGTHANSTIIYNVEGKGYEYFETLVGIDRNISQQNNSSVIFQIFADGEKVFDSGLMKWSDNAKLARIKLDGVSELKLVANNGGNGNTSDHANFADAKFLITNSKPTIDIASEGITTKLGVEVSLDSEYSATDAEDGDLTNKVVVEDNVNFNKAGKYEQTFTVTDSDGNTTIKTRYIKVVDMNDTTYISDIDWTSAQIGWNTIKKDKAVSGNALRLTDESGREVSYEKGIGTHSTSTIKYDLTNDDYGYFTSFVGVDRTMYGSVGSVTFEIYLDNEKVYDSGLMSSRDAQKYVEINLKDAKELKLVVTDGKNGNGSDHANFADAKLHFANSESVEVNRVNLDELIENVNSINEANYTIESYKVVKDTLAVVENSLNDGYNQVEIDELYNTLKEAYDNLVSLINWNDLIDAIENNNEYNELNYYKDVMESHKNLINEARNMIEENQSTQEEIDSMCNRILESSKNLVARENKIALNKAIEKAESIENVNYNSIRWKNLQDALVDAKVIYNDVNASDIDVESFTFLMNYLIDELK
ncbi:NPCBM/NEW2 domain-containing protein [Romboutsia sp. Marseille-P6047]|uniref:NPCBM/NEW2 domain-containing protein n=1 Tax=Romboutsia sp. Marseille-P6047 TaxID=2161817 RepID=UPI000F067D2F|nr:NPCBM/NEW2 domain-containing protein [Romboutsia sp. Marseille-P6047]